MSRTPLPLHVGDVSALARSLRTQLAACDQTPGHLQLLNMLARATGYRNFQHFQAQCAAQTALARPQPEPETVDFVRLGRLARHFDAKGRLVRWPGKAGLRLPCLWTLWAKLPRGQTLDENQINMRLNDCHLFNDPALLRRELFDNGLVTRTPDCREYRRLEKRPPADALALIRLLAERGE